MFPYLPGQSLTNVADDDVWIADYTPVEGGRSRETAKRSALAGWAEYGYCASHSRDFWELRLHLVCTLHGLPLGWALVGAKTDEREDGNEKSRATVRHLPTVVQPHPNRGSADDQRFPNSRSTRTHRTEPNRDTRACRSPLESTSSARR